MLAKKDMSLETALAALFVGGLTSSTASIASGELKLALVCALVTGTCAIIVAGAAALAKIIKGKGPLDDSDKSEDDA